MSIQNLKMKTWNLKIVVEFDIITNFIENISNVISESRLIVNEKGISVSAQNGSHVIAVFGNINKDELNEYSLTENFELGLNFDDVLKILKSFPKSKDDERVQILHSTTDKRLWLVYGNSMASLSLIDIDVEILNDDLLKVVYDNRVKINTKLLKDSIESVDSEGKKKGKSNSSEIVTFEIVKNGIKLTNKTKEKETLIRNDDLDENYGKQEGKIIMGRNNLKQVMKSIGKISSKVELSFSNDSSLQISMKSGYMSNIIFVIGKYIIEE